MTPVIICVEDEPILRETIVEELTDAGYIAIGAANGAEGLIAINKHKPNLVICDIQMPVMDGNEMLVSLREDHPEFDSIPFLFLSGRSERENIIEGRLRGADDYLVKPIDYTLLLATIESRLMSTSRIEASKQAELDELRSSILGLLPHELRTPLNHIIGFSSMIKDETLGPIENDKYLEYANDINKSGEHLMSIINNVLYLSDAISGSFESDFKECDVSDAINNLIPEYSELAKDGDIKLTVSVDNDLPSVTATDEMLNNIFSSLLSNAIKFTPSGGSVTVKASAELMDIVTIVISDTGIGIEEENITKVMRAFGRAEDDMTRSTGGTGIGLTLAKALTELLGGELELQSELGKGTKVSLRFNVQEMSNILH